MKRAAWASSLLAQHWSELSAAVPHDDLPIIASERKGRITLDVFACGSYGCVLPVSRQDVVLKISEDDAEASFAAACVEADNPSPGIVRYDRVARLGGTTRPTFLLWREEAQDVGALFHRPVGPEPGHGELYTDWGPKGGFFLWLDRFRHAADQARRQVARGARTGARLGAALEAALASGSHPALDVGWVPDWEARLKLETAARRGPDRMAFLLAACRWCAERLALEPWGADVGGAMLHWLRRGVLLADVHALNVGQALRDDGPVAVITDPGHAVFLAGEAPEVSLLAPERRRNGTPRDSEARLEVAMEALGLLGELVVANPSGRSSV